MPHKCCQKGRKRHRSLGEDVRVVLVGRKRSNVRTDGEWSPTWVCVGRGRKGGREEEGVSVTHQHQHPHIAHQQHTTHNTQH